MCKPLPNILQTTAFKKHVPFLIDCKRGESDNSSSKMFFFLPSRTYRKENINQWAKNVHLHTTDCPYDDFRRHTLENSKIKESRIQHQELDRSCAETRKCILNFMKHAVNLSNNNLIRNPNALMQNKDAKIDKEHLNR